MAKANLTISEVFTSQWTKQDIQINTTDLTANEIKVMIAGRNNEYGDAYLDGCTWSFTVCDNSGLSEKTYRGVVSSLIKKGLITVSAGSKNPEADGDHPTFSYTEAGMNRFAIRTPINNEPNKMIKHHITLSEASDFFGVNIASENLDKFEVNGKLYKLDFVATRCITQDNLYNLYEIEEETNMETTTATNTEVTTTTATKKTASKTPKTVQMFAFTGMDLGHYEYTQKGNTITIPTQKGDLTFDKKTGVQTNSKNPRYANRISIIK